MEKFKLDGRKLRFLSDPKTYIEKNKTGDSKLIIDPLARQFCTVKVILARLQHQEGVLLADDVGLGKTTVAAIVAWVVALNGMRVRIYAPNKVMRRRWAKELERHIPMLWELGARRDLIKYDVKRLNDGRIQVATHTKLVSSKDKQNVACDLMIIDEVHRAKGESSKLSDAIDGVGNNVKRKLILTATPFSIHLSELERMLLLVGATEDEIEVVRAYDDALKKLYKNKTGDEESESKKLVSIAQNAIKVLQPYLIRNSIDNISKSERKYFGNTVVLGNTEVKNAKASDDDVSLLLRMDRILQLMPDQKKNRRNDPRYHIGWYHLWDDLITVENKSGSINDDILHKHINCAKLSLTERLKVSHPKIAAVTESIQSIISNDEKVLVFCSHHATAFELLDVLLCSLKIDEAPSLSNTAEKAWREAWECVFMEWVKQWDEDERNKFVKQRDFPLLKPVIDWLCTTGLYRQITEWLDEPEDNTKGLIKQLRTTRPRNAPKKAPSIAAEAINLADSLLDPQSKSTRKLLIRMTKHELTYGESHFPGNLDGGFITMGAWNNEKHKLETLYKNKPDIVIAIFNSPFGPDILVTTDHMSEGVDLHHYCRHLIHYELDPSPMRIIQRNGRVRRVGSWAAKIGEPVCYAYPAFRRTRDEKAVEIMKKRIKAFDLLLGGVPPVDDTAHLEDDFAARVINLSGRKLEKCNKALKSRL